jgi:beta-1,4-N-acetylglucosaminyltransferase
MAPAGRQQPHLLVVLGDGGHTAEIVRLVGLLGPEYTYTYLATSNDKISESKIPYPGNVYRLMRPRGKDESIIRAAWHLSISLVQAAGLLLRCRPQAVLGSGPAVFVPPALLGKLVGAKVIFVETGSRITELSLTGKIMLRLADRFFVQWEPLHQRYPQAIYAGRLL